MVYFNLSQAAADPKQAAFIEEERRVAYVGATRSKDDLLITFASTKPSEFLWEIALNPKYRELDEEDLQRGFSIREPPPGKGEGRFEAARSEEAK